MALCPGGKLRSVGIHGHEGTYGYAFHCPGCDHSHVVWVKENPDRKTHVWQFSGDEANPTFSPSLLVRHEMWTPPVTPENHAEWQKNPWPQTKVPHVCHSYIRNGKIEFLGDCTHALAGKTVEIPSQDHTTETGD